MLGAFFLAIGTYPYMQIGSSFAAEQPVLFVALATLGNLFVFVFLFAMAYAVAFFGISWPDRIVKSRLVKWFLRGPVTIFVVLLLMTVIYRAGEFFNTTYTVAIPIFTVTTVLLMEHVITLIYPFIERWFFYGDAREDIELVQKLSERLLTSADLRQFLEAVLASVCDRFQVSTAFLAGLDDEGLDYVVQEGAWEYLKADELSKVLLENVAPQAEDNPQPLFAWGDFWLHPLYSPQDGALIGLLGVLRNTDADLDQDLAEALLLLGQRAALALEDRRVQTQIFQALEALSPQVDLIQRLRAASRYDQSELLGEFESREQPKDLNRWVKDALTHYWGGPKLTQSPLLRLQIVQATLTEHDSNAANALRAILKEGIDRVRPEGERRFTPEWILYNILEMKFMEGRKVREIALRLAMSEADLYRKQRVAIEEVANAIVDMERVATAN